MSAKPEQSEPDELALSLDPVPQNAARARHAVEALVERCGLQITAPAARVVVTEAFTNAAKHAYAGGELAPIDVSARKRDHSLEICVRDRGSGFRPRPVDETSRGRLGLLMMAAVSDLLQIQRLPGGGTEVCALVSANGALAAH